MDGFGGLRAPAHPEQLAKRMWDWKVRTAVRELSAHLHESGIKSAQAQTASPLDPAFTGTMSSSVTAHAVVSAPATTND